jgi:hypothetical protein
MAKRKAYHAEWQRKNKDKVRSYNKAYQERKKTEGKNMKITNINQKLTDEELSDLFAYCARLASMVAPANAREYYGFTFDGAVKDTFYGLAMLYAGEGIAHNIEEFKEDECYGPTLKQMLSDIRRILED